MHRMQEAHSAAVRAAGSYLHYPHSHTRILLLLIFSLDRMSRKVQGSSTLETLAVFTHEPLDGVRRVGLASYLKFSRVAQSKKCPESGVFSLLETIWFNRESCLGSLATCTVLTFTISIWMLSCGAGKLDVALLNPTASQILSHTPLPSDVSNLAASFDNH